MTGNRVWTGNAALAPMLVPLGELQPHPRNPRLGDVAEIAKSLRRFGQQRPVLALPDGTLVAGHHVWQAARDEGWTHLAVVRSDLADAEVDAYLLADNRLADLGLYDDAALAALLAPFAEGDALDGLGYTTDDLTGLLAYLEPPTLERAKSGGPPAEQPYALGIADLYRILLSYDRSTYEALVDRLDAIMEARGLDSYSDAVAAVVLDAAP